VAARPAAGPAFGRAGRCVRRRRGRRCGSRLRRGRPSGGQQVRPEAQGSSVWQAAFGGGRRRAGQQVRPEAQGAVGVAGRRVDTRCRLPRPVPPGQSMPGGSGAGWFTDVAGVAGAAVSVRTSSFGPSTGCVPAVCASSSFASQQFATEQSVPPPSPQSAQHAWHEGLKPSGSGRDAERPQASAASDTATAGSARTGSAKDRFQARTGFSSKPEPEVHRVWSGPEPLPEFGSGASRHAGR